MLRRFVGLLAWLALGAARPAHALLGVSIAGGGQNGSVNESSSQDPALDFATHVYGVGYTAGDAGVAYFGEGSFLGICPGYVCAWTTVPDSFSYGEAVGSAGRLRASAYGAGGAGMVTAYFTDDVTFFEDGGPAHLEVDLLVDAMTHDVSCSSGLSLSLEKIAFSEPYGLWGVSAYEDADQQYWQSTDHPTEQQGPLEAAHGVVEIPFPPGESQMTLTLNLQLHVDAFCLNPNQMSSRARAFDEGATLRITTPYESLNGYSYAPEPDGACGIVALGALAVVGRSAARRTRDRRGIIRSSMRTSGRR